MKFIDIVRYFINFFYHFLQLKILNFLKKNLGKDLIFFDVGAHHGESIKLFFKILELKLIVLRRVLKILKF